MSRMRIRGWTLEIVVPVHLRRDRTPAHAPKNLAGAPQPTIHRDPTPTPGAFQPPVDLFREIARGGRALE
jgi:hypothetical protein